MKLALALLFAGVLCAQDSFKPTYAGGGLNPRGIRESGSLLPSASLGRQQTNLTQWRWSVAALAAANALDMASSRGLYETNPVLGRGPFGARQVAIKSGLVAGLVLAEHRIVRRWPRAERPFRWLNYVAAGVTVGVSVHNWRQ